MGEARLPVQWVPLLVPGEEIKGRARKCKPHLRTCSSKGRKGNPGQGKMGWKGHCATVAREDEVVKGKETRGARFRW